jgi:hypothetical protein
MLMKSKVLLIPLFALLAIAVPSVFALFTDDVDGVTELFPTDSIAVTDSATLSVSTSDSFNLTDDVEIDYKSILIPFIQNTGQLDENVKFYADTFAGRVFVTNDDLIYSLNTDSGSYVINESLQSGSLIDFQGLKQNDMSINYFVGNDPDKWQSQIPVYDGVSLGQVWNGVDVSLYAYGNNVEKIFTVMPGYDSSTIQLSYNGISKIKLDENNGDLVLYSLDDEPIMSMTAPIAYQMIDDKKIDVAVNYVIIDNMTYGFAVGDYDDRYSLVIDPLIQSTWVGGTAKETTLTDVGIDSDENVFFVMHVAHNPTNANHTITNTGGGVYDTAFGDEDDFDVMIVKVSNDLQEILQATYLGGSKAETYNSKLAINPTTGDVYVAGRTYSTDFSGVSGNPYFDNGNPDVYVTHLSNDLETLYSSIIIGGEGYDNTAGLDIDSNGDLFLLGSSNSAYVREGHNQVRSTTDGGLMEDKLGDNYGLFVSKINGDLSGIIQSTWIGGSNGDSGSGLLINPSNEAVIVGYTTSTDIIGITSDVFQSYHAGGVNACHFSPCYGAMDLYVSILSNDLESIKSTYVGGIGFEAWPSFDIDSDGNIFIGSETKGAPFPGISDESAFGNDAFIADIPILDIFSDTGDADDDSEILRHISDGNLKVATNKNQNTTLLAIIDYSNSSPSIDDETLFSLTCETEDDFTNNPECRNYNGNVVTLNCDDFVQYVPTGRVTLNSGDCESSTDAIGRLGWIEKRIQTKDFKFENGTKLTDPNTGRKVQEFNQFTYSKHYKHDLVNVLIKVSPDLTQVKSTYYPTSSTQGFSDIAIDSYGYVYGTSQAGADPRDNAGLDADSLYETKIGGANDSFVAKFTSDLTELIQTTLVGTDKQDGNSLLIIDSNNDVFVFDTVGSDSATLIGVTGGAQETNNGSGEIWISKLSDDLQHDTPADPNIPEIQEDPDWDDYVASISTSVSSSSSSQEKSGTSIALIKTWAASEKDFGAAINHLITINLIDSHEIRGEIPKWVYELGYDWSQNRMENTEFWNAMKYLIDQNIVK